MSDSDDMFRDDGDDAAAAYDYVLGGGVSRKGCSPAMLGRSPAMMGRSPALYGRSPALYGQSPASRGRMTPKSKSSRHSKTEDTLEELDLGQSSAQAAAEAESKAVSHNVRVNISTCTQGQPKKPIIIERLSDVKALKKLAKAKLRLSNKQCTKFFDYSTTLELKDTMTVNIDALVVVTGPNGLDRTSERDFSNQWSKLEGARKKAEWEKQRQLEEEERQQELAKKKEEAAKKGKKNRRKKGKKGQRTHIDSDEEEVEGLTTDEEEQPEEEQPEEEWEEDGKKLGRSKRRKQKKKLRAKTPDPEPQSPSNDGRRGKTGKGKGKNSKQTKKRNEVKEAELQKARDKKERRLAREAKEAEKKDELWYRNQNSNRDREVKEELEKEDTKGKTVDQRWADNNKAPQRERLAFVRGGFMAEKRLRQKFVDKERDRLQRG